MTADMEAISDLRSSDNSDDTVPGSILASVGQVPVDNSRRFPTLPMLNLRYQELGQMRNMDKRQHQHCFLSVLLVELS
jgi:hypothetical protein